LSADQSIKVFQVLAGGPGGGGAVVVRALTERLMEEGCQVWVLCLSDEVSRRFAEVGANVVASHNWRREINPMDALAFYELFKLCRTEKFDIVHTHTSKGGLLGRIAARLAGVPIVIHTVHGFSFNELTPRLATSFFVFLERIASRFCDVMISVTDQHRAMAIEKKMARPDKIITIHNGIDLGQFEGLPDAASIRRELGLERDATLIGTVGRLSSQKGQMYLLEAMPHVVREYPQARLVLVGDGPEEAEFKDLAVTLGVADHCRFMGFRRDVPKFLACLDIFVQPSPREGLSITLLEAMAAGRPVIATNITGNREVVEDGVNGVLCQPMDSMALANALIDLLENPEKARLLGARAREQVEQEFEEQMMLNQTIALYRAQIEGALPFKQSSLGRAL
jgi:glycosyltransferase involved in cell wall biosynthesis